MRTHLHLISLVLALFFLSAAAIGDRRSNLAGGWQPIKDTSEPHVLEVAKFAVTEHNKQANARLGFQKVVSGETQVVAGVNYRLVVAAEDGAGANKYEAVVWEKAWIHFMNLTSFKPISRV